MAEGSCAAIRPGIEVAGCAEEVWGSLVPRRSWRKFQLSIFASLRGCSNIFSEIESGHRKWSFRNPTPHLLAVGVLAHRSAMFCDEALLDWLRFARRDQRPIRRIMKGKIEIGHRQPAIGIPVAARAHVEQSFASLRQHFSTVNEAQSDLLSLSYRLGQNQQPPGRCHCGPAACPRPPDSE